MSTTTTYTSGKKGFFESISASLATLYRRRWLAVYFAQREMSSTYRSSYLGFVWALLAPLLMIALLTLVFSEIIGIRFREVEGDSSLNFGLFLYCGLLPFLSFSEALTKSSNSIRSSTALVQRVVFPLEVLPLTRALTVQVDKVFGVVVLIAVAYFIEGRLYWTVLLLPALIVIQMLFVVGVCYTFAVVGTYLPDVREILRPFIRAMFFITPIIFPAGRVPEEFSFLVDYNPLAFLVNAYRDLVLSGTVPSLTSTLWFTLFAAALCFCGLALFVRTKPNFADLL